MPKIFFTLYFDAALEERIRRVWDVLARSGVERDAIPEHRPHISLVAYDVEDVASLDQRLGAFAAKRSPIPIRLHHIGIFPEKSVVFLGPRRTRELERLQRSISREFSAPGDPPVEYENLRVENWVPHCTLTTAPPERTGAIVRALQESWEPLSGTAEGIGVLAPPETRDRFHASFGRTRR